MEYPAIDADAFEKKRENNSTIKPTVNREEYTISNQFILTLNKEKREHRKRKTQKKEKIPRIFIVGLQLVQM